MIAAARVAPRTGTGRSNLAGLMICWNMLLLQTCPIFF
jgi:hypothetical protein